MYIPKLYREEDRQKIIEFLRQNNFPALVSHDGEKLTATHLPVEIIESEEGALTVLGTCPVRTRSGRALASRKCCSSFREHIPTSLRAGTTTSTCRRGIT